jgi:hypothetical protein
MDKPDRYVERLLDLKSDRQRKRYLAEHDELLSGGSALGPAGFDSASPN